MKILLFTREYPPFNGGIGVYTEDLAAGLSNLGQQVFVIAPHYREAHAPAPGVKVNRFRIKRSRFRGLFALAVGILRHRPDVVHIMDGTVLGMAGWLLRFWRRDFYYTVHGSELHWYFNKPGWKGRRLDQRSRRAFGQAKGLICVSTYTRELLKKTLPGIASSHVVRNGVRLDRLPGPAPRVNGDHGGKTRLNLLTVARAIPEKGVDTMIRLLPALRRRICDIRYTVAGDGAYLGALKALAREQGVADIVDFRGKVSDVERAELFQQADVFVLLSRKGGRVEGFGLAVIEAGYCGVPAIGSGLEGIRDAIVDGETGILVDPEQPQEIIAAVLKLAGDQPLRHRMGAAARKATEEYYNHIRMARETLAVYEKP